MREKFQKNNIKIVTILLVILLMTLGMTAFEYSKEIFLSNLDIWESHIITIVFSTLIATIASFFVIKKQQVLYNNIREELYERKKVEAEKEKMQNKLFHASKLASIGILATGVAHEINNPLAVIMGNLAILKRVLKNAINNDLVFESLERQKRSVDRISSIINNLRTFARPDSKTVQSVSVHEVLEDSIQVIENLCDYENIIIKKKFEAKKDVVLGDNGRLQQVFINLFSNSKDAFVQNNSGIIEVITSNQGRELKIIISDNGCGIEKDKLNQIFETFYTTKTIGQGTGLGLWISNSIIKSMEGNINVSSEMNAGTSFTIILPTIENIIIQEKEKETQLSFKKISGKVLIVDDEKDVRDTLSVQLKAFGLKVYTAQDGEEALKMIKKSYYNYVITDLRMPRFGGESLLEEMSRMRLKNTKTIITTGHMSFELDAKNNDVFSKADKFLKKPFSELSLYQALTE